MPCSKTHEGPVCLRVRLCEKVGERVETVSQHPGIVFRHVRVEQASAQENAGNLLRKFDLLPALFEVLTHWFHQCFKDMSEIHAGHSITEIVAGGICRWFPTNG